jgi:hypothetical protein
VFISSILAIEDKNGALGDVKVESIVYILLIII